MRSVRTRRVGSKESIFWRLKNYQINSLTSLAVELAQIVKANGKSESAYQWLPGIL